MVEVCPICLDVAVEGLVYCEHGHPMHAACALEMRRGMGREECPVCTGRMLNVMAEELTGVVGWLVLLEHAMHVLVAYWWLLFVWFHLLDSSVLGEDARLRARLARATLLGRRSLTDHSQGDLQAVRMHSVMVVLWMHGMAVFVGQGYFRMCVMCVTDAFGATIRLFGYMLVPCPGDLRCVQGGNETMVWNKFGW